MHKYYLCILGIMDTLNEWNDKLNILTEKYADNVLVGTIILGALLFIGCWGVNTLYKK